jgi:hypothetical protein
MYGTWLPFRNARYECGTVQNKYKFQARNCSALLESLRHEGVAGCRNKEAACLVGDHVVGNSEAGDSEVGERCFCWVGEGGNCHEIVLDVRMGKRT